MDMDYYEKTMGETYEAQALAQALDDIRAGHVLDGPSALADIENAVDSNAPTLRQPHLG